jgi:AcrR family transcriptional regulator
VTDAPGSGDGAAPRNKTAAALLEASIEMLAARGEAGFRVEDVLETCGASPSSLYHHFGSRDGLIEAATFEAYRRMTEEDFVVVRAAFSDAADPEDLLARLRVVARLFEGGDRAVLRLERLRLLGASVTRPALREKLGADIDRVTDELSGLFADGKRRGLIRPDVDTHAAAMFAQAFTFGFVLDDIAGDGIAMAGWVTMIDAFHEGIIVQA